MPSQHDTEHQVLDVIVRSPGCLLEEVVLECPDLTWNQVFLAVDRLTRNGELQLTPKGRGLYTLHFSNNSQDGPRHQATV